MRLIKLLYKCLLLSLLVFALGTGRGFAAPLAQSNTWIITSPGEGSVVSGQVSIVGTATHSSFASYGVLYAAGPTPTGSSQWVALVFGVSTMVANGVLATWDTTVIPNGSYTLALAVYEQGNSEPHLYFTNGLIVQNEAVTPTPTATPVPLSNEPQPGEPVATQALGTAPEAPAIQQPPTATPRPTPTLSPETAASAEEPDSGDSGLNLKSLFPTEAVKEAAILGVQLAFVIYAVAMLYVAAKAAIRYYRRQTRKGSAGE